MLLLGAAWLLCLGGGVCSAADVTLRPRAMVTSGLVRLGDVADITAEDEAVAERLRRLPLMPAPAPGTRTVVTAGGVRELVTASGEDLHALRFSGAIRVAIGDAPSETLTPPRRTFAEPTPTQAPTWTTTRDAAPPVATRPKQQTGFRRSRPSSNARPRPRSLPRATLSRVAAQRLKGELSRRLSAFAQQKTGNPMMEALVPEIDERRLGSLSLATSPLSVETTTAVGVGRQRFLVSFDTDQGRVKFPVYASVQPARPAVFVVRAVPRGATITRADVEVRSLPFDARVTPNRAPFTSIDEVVGNEAATTLRPNTLLDEGNCLPPMLVRRGSEVTVVAAGGGIRVRLRAKAQANGRLGEVVPVEPYNTRERLMARVVASGELAVLSAERSNYTASLPRSIR